MWKMVMMLQNKNQIDLSHFKDEIHLFLLWSRMI